MSKVRLFVYGTLNEPEALTRLLGSRERWREVGSGCVRGMLFDLGDYPGLVASESTHDQVRGMVIELADPEIALTRLDAYEGVHDGLYVRTEMPVRLEGGRSVNAWVYVYNRPTAKGRRITAWPP